jgi:hypothetical protein
MEPLPGLEPGTPSLPWKCSTTELQRHTPQNNILADKRVNYDLIRICQCILSLLVFQSQIYDTQCRLGNSR